MQTGDRLNADGTVSNPRKSLRPIHAPGVEAELAKVRFGFLDTRQKCLHPFLDGCHDLFRSAAFVSERGMPGFAPTQGHLASALCYMPHALDRLTTGDARKVMLLAKGSLFLGRMCQLSDGRSVLPERHDAR